jgi:hypothetical protein
MNNSSVDINELVNALNSQIASMNLELTIARIQVANLQKVVAELSQQTQQGNSDDFVTPPTRNKSK